jgi:hypothetical protein
MRRLAVTRRPREASRPSQHRKTWGDLLQLQLRWQDLGRGWKAKLGARVQLELQPSMLALQMQEAEGTLRWVGAMMVTTRPQLQVHPVHEPQPQWREASAAAIRLSWNLSLNLNLILLVP